MNGATFVCQRCKQPLKIHDSLTDISPAAFDLLVCNPPFPTPALTRSAAPPLQQWQETNLLFASCRRLSPRAQGNLRKSHETGFFADNQTGCSYDEECPPWGREFPSRGHNGVFCRAYTVADSHCFS